MGSGVLHPAKLARAVADVVDVPGDFAEIGVYQGGTFRHLVAHAREQERMSYAFDSFSGMADPGLFDGKDYPRGRFDVGGPEAFMKLMDALGIEREWYAIGAGYVPRCFEGFEDVKIALAYLDLDHFEPTARALPWAWERLSPGGILICDDYEPGKAMLASVAIDRWLPWQLKAEQIGGIENDQLMVRKLR
jgi:hypothetical protein